ncbi:hypothetical protein F8M41_023881 [Gigaspora margarita]|uniref:Uncharacterized protein n=1 Tax=Gigaspora margarita TaxID=4874 RepID=A0A8H4ACN9_GIGMA|nr:hypothetical protein F8M41_023881 [Gigaspora margarita]
MIEWNYPALSTNTPSYAETNTPSTSGNKRRSRDGLEQSQKQFNSHYTSTQNFYKKPSQRQPRANNSTSSLSGLNSEKS